MRIIPGADQSYMCALPPKGLANLPGPQSEQPMERVLRATAARYTLDNPGGAGTDVTVQFFAHNPSPRLRWSVTVGWELDGNKRFVLGGLATPTWQMTAIRISDTGGPTADLNAIFVDVTGVATNRNLPDGYELDSAVKDVRGQLNLHDGSGYDLSIGLAGNLIIEARWEPHDAMTDRNEIWQLLQRADLKVIGASPRTINVGT